MLDAVLATPKLSAVMAVLFVSLSIPILVFILISNDHQISAALFAERREEAAKTRVATIDSARTFSLHQGALPTPYAG